jgi:Flp pilus assembly protein TadD
LSRLKLPAWKNPAKAADELLKHAWDMARLSASPFRRTAVALADEVAKLAPDKYEMHRVAGIARYRAQDYAGAVSSLKRSLVLQPNENITTSLFLAMALQQQGKTTEARQWHAKAAAWMANQKTVHSDLKQLEQDARSLIEQ